MTTHIATVPARRPRTSGRRPRLKNRYAYWRAATLASVYVLMAAHVAHWLVTGKTLAPLELNEVMHTLELGIVTAGFIFMAVAVLATAIFGRFFCSWGCHILALQDLCAWILKKLHIRRPHGVRSRVLLWVPVVAALYMFAWPQAVRVWEGRDLPRLRVAADEDGWASFSTNDFWRNLPDPGITLMTFGVCGFVIVYVLGTRGFCTYGCPYGAIFRAADRVAPGRIRVGSDCVQCGTCTATCTSHVRVHEELARYGMVVDSACMKDLDCVAACPQQSLHFGFGRPAAARTVVDDTTVRKSYDFNAWEECLLVAVFVIVLLIYRGLYDSLPFLMSIGLGTIGAYLAVVFARLFYRDTVRLNRGLLKTNGRMQLAGWVFGAVGIGIGLLTLHSGLVRYHTHQGRRFHLVAMHAEKPNAALTQRAIEHLQIANRWGLIALQRNDLMLAELHGRSENWSPSNRHYERVLQKAPNHLPARVALAGSLARQGRRAEALGQYEHALMLQPERAVTHYRIAGLHFDDGNVGQSVQHLREAIRLRTDYAEAHYDLGAILTEIGDLTGGVRHLREAVALRPSFADAHYNLAVALALSGDGPAARNEINAALSLKPDDPQSLAFSRHLLQRSTNGKGGVP